jgi:hypothetical protein
MMITKRSLSRRTVLRGIGATLALPMLDSMVPAFAAPQNPVLRPVRRLGAIYVPNGIMMNNWTPAVEGAGFEFTPILKPLEAFRDRLLVLSGFANKEADPLPGEGAGDHSRGPAAFLTGVHAKKTEGADIQVGVSMDQIAARQLGRETQLASLELGLESSELMGSCDTGYSCAYQGTISWRSPTTPLPMENNPRAVFERLFGDSGSTDSRARSARVRTQRSLLDSVTQKVARLESELGPRDRAKLSEYLEAVRDVERRIQRAEEQNANELPVLEQPGGVPGTFEEHAKLMFDLQALAYQCDLTRVITFMMGREVSGRTYPQIGVPDPHHPISHHQKNPEKMAKVTRVNTHHASMFAYFLEKLRSTPDGDGSLLDNTLIIYGSGLSDGDLHNHVDLPILVAGAGGGQIKGGRHIRFPNDAPLANLHVTLLDKLGIPLEKLGDSTGRIDHLSID